MREVSEGPECTEPENISFTTAPYLPFAHLRTPGCNLDAAVGYKGAGTKL